MEKVEAKRCSSCAAEKPVGEYGKNRTRKDRLQHCCNECRRERRIENRDEINAKRRARYIKNREAERHQQAEYQAEHREEIRAYQARYRAENPEKRRESTKRWQAENPERVKEIKTRSRKLRPQSSRSSCQRRRARKRGAPIIQKTVLATVAKRSKYRCGICGVKVDMDLKVPDLMAPTEDHIIPLNLGGSHIYANLQLAHFGCNSGKRDRYEGQLALL